MITARSPYQVYKATEAKGTVADFNSLPSEEVLPYKIVSAEEALLASLAVVEESTEKREKYAVSALRAASIYVSHLISYGPLSARSQTAKKVSIHYDAIVRTVMLFGTKVSFFESVRSMVEANVPAHQVSLKDLSDLEGALNAMEKEYRQRARDAGEKVDLLRKVAPEPVSIPVAPTTTPARSGDPSHSGGGEGAVEDESDTTAAASNRGLSSRRCGRSRSSDAAADADVLDDAHVSKALKVETVLGSEVLVTAPSQKGVFATKKARVGRGGLIWGRPRALTSNEKKAIGILNSVIQILAHVFATKFNGLVPVFDLLTERLATVQTIMDTERAQYEAKEDKKPPEPFHAVTLDGLRLALEHSSDTFRNDEECRYELDEDLLHPIAHACLTLINRIEGYATEPFKGPTPEELVKKQQLREAAREKQEEAKRRMVKRAEAKAELERKKEEERQLMRRRLGEGVEEERLEEDTTLLNPPTLGYVAYTADIPLGDVGLFEKALYIWATLVSVPRALNLSQMPFTTFVKGIECEDQDANGLMEEVTKCLLDVSMETVRMRTPQTPRITTRGKNWFDTLIEFVAVASGNKKHRQQQRRLQKHDTSSSEETEDEDEDSESGKESSSESEEEENSGTPDSSSSSTTRKRNGSRSSSVSTTGDDINTAEDTAMGNEEEKEEAAADPARKDQSPSNLAATAAPQDEVVDTDPFSLELRATMQTVEKLRSLATWGNIEVVDRLNLLQCCVQEALCCDDVRAEADRLKKVAEEEALTVEKKLKEIRETAEKGVKALLRTLPAATTTSANKKKSRVLKKGDVKVEGETEDNGSAKENDLINEDNADPDLTSERDFEADREAILKVADRERESVFAKLYGTQDDGDNGVIITPLGRDRYRRLFWRFPMERVIRVQAVQDLAATAFPVLPEPQALRQSRTPLRALLLDDELPEAPRGRGRSSDQAIDNPNAEMPLGERDGEVPQTTWGTIPRDYLEAFVQTLDRRGEREGPLRHAMETLVPYLANMEEPREGRETRSRAHMFGYLNRLKELDDATCAVFLMPCHPFEREAPRIVEVTKKELMLPLCSGHTQHGQAVEEI